MSARSKIVEALVTKLKAIDGTGDFESTIFGNAFNKLKFWNEVDDYPSLYLNAGPETRQYLPGGFKWGDLSLTIRIYVRGEEPEKLLEPIMSDVERIIDANGNLDYDSGKKTEDINIMSINTDEGLLAPHGVGEIILHIKYDL